MNDNRPAEELPGIRLMSLLETRLTEIIRQESNNENHIHLYTTGDYWAAFEQSACLLCEAFPASETTIITSHTAYPFPVVMATITDNELRTYTRKHILRKDNLEYKILSAPALSFEHYREWHNREVQEFL